MMPMNDMPAGGGGDLNYLPRHPEEQDVRALAHKLLQSKAVVELPDGHLLAHDAYNVRQLARHTSRGCRCACAGEAINTMASKAAATTAAAMAVPFLAERVAAMSRREGGRQTIDGEGIKKDVKRCRTGRTVAACHGCGSAVFVWSTASCRDTAVAVSD
ncbi:hypothetical protein Taro_053080 [Colocasia esculenta]|uniref:Uncharacterized protein n=1 Tax=Colocasia esculenta TaxID=4460 RepID=A0A843XL57_COLES|nr:hypothetical protein [Colocasia esculenta]